MDCSPLDTGPRDSMTAFVFVTRQKLAVCVCVYLSAIVLCLFFSTCVEGRKDYTSHMKAYWMKWDRRWDHHKIRHHHHYHHSTKNEEFEQAFNLKLKKHSRRSSLYTKPSPKLKDTKGTHNGHRNVCSEEPRKFNDTEEEICPEFAKDIENVTQAVGRNAKMECVVDNLGRFRVAWMRIETKTVLTMHSRVISRNYRISLSQSDNRVFVLHIRNVQVEDSGSYMCQVNTQPMMSQIGYLDVVVPPDIIEEGTSPDLFVREGVDVTLKCSARGHPQPEYMWRREDKKPVVSGNWQSTNLAQVIRMSEDKPEQKNLTVFEGAQLTIHKVSRLHMGAYLCIATNGVPPAVSRRVQLQVQFPPMIWIPNQLVGAKLGGSVTVECNTEAFPESINYWSRHEGQMVPNAGRFSVILKMSSYKVNMILTIYRMVHEDYGIYKCFAKNSLGSTEGTIRIYQIEGLDSQYDENEDNMPNEPKSVRYLNTSITNGELYNSGTSNMQTNFWITTTSITILCLCLCLGT